MDLNSLVVFAHVVEGSGFSQAARRLRMPVSTVSRRIAELEAELGFRLLERSTRRVRLTERGAEILEHARRSVELREAIGAVVSREPGEVDGLLRLSAPPSITDTLLTPLIGAFQGRFPRIRVELFVTSRPVDLVADGVDLSFTLGTVADPALVARTMLTYRHRIVASPAYLDGRDQPRSPDDLLRHRLLAFSFRQPLKRWTLVETIGGEQQTVTFRPHLEMNDYAGLAAALLAGVGIGELPPIVRPELLAEGRLVEVLPGWRFTPLDLSLVHLAHRRLAPAVYAFRDVAAEVTPSLFPFLPG